MSSWVRLWHDMPTDPKWRVIARKSGQRVGDVIAVFTFLMVSASANADERGRTQGVVHEDIACALDMEEADVCAILNAMKGKVLEEDGTLSGWEKRQPKREDNSADRAKAWREERKRTQTNAQERPDADADADKTPTNVGVGKTSKAKGSRLPIDWKPDDADLTFALSQNMNHEEIKDEADKFRDFWCAKPGAGGVKLDWSATWRNWCRNRRGQGSRQAGNANASGNRSKPSSMAGILAERRRQAANADDVSNDGWVLREG